MLQFLNKYLFAVLTMAGLLLTAAAASAQPYQSEQPPQTPPAKVDSATIDKFVDAYADVQSIQQEFSQKIQSADESEKATALQQEAQQKMQQAIADNGLSVGEYQQIIAQTGQDTELRSRIEEKLNSSN